MYNLDVALLKILSFYRKADHNYVLEKLSNFTKFAHHDIDEILYLAKAFLKSAVFLDLSCHTYTLKSEQVVGREFADIATFHDLSEEDICYFTTEALKIVNVWSLNKKLDFLRSFSDYNK